MARIDGEGDGLDGADDSLDGPEPPPVLKKGPPKWMMLTGCGCLIPGFLGIAVVAWALQLIGTAVKETFAWDELAEVIEFDADAARGAPTGVIDDPDTIVDESRAKTEFRMFFGKELPFSKGVAVFHLGRDVSGPFDDEKGYGPDPLFAIFQKLPSAQTDEAVTDRRTGFPGEPFEIEVQGRSLRGHRLPEMEAELPYLRWWRTDAVEGVGVAVRVREAIPFGEDADRTFDILLFLLRPDSDVAITDEEIRHFLAPYHVGPDR